MVSLFKVHYFCFVKIDNKVSIIHPFNYRFQTFIQVLFFIIIQSSANYIIGSIIDFEMSFMYTKKSSGPSTLR